MKQNKRILSASVAAAVMLLLILDTKTAAEGAAEGIDLCVKVIIPSLFPFFIVTTYLNASLLGLHIPGLHMLGRKLKVPAGSESLLFLGLIGGYPVGAQLIADTYRQGRLDRKTGHILLGYCSNAGPAFIFGITSILFSSPWIPFFLWGIHLISAVLTGLLLPKPEHASLSWENTADISLVQALRKSISICASVCGWVIIFKIVMAYLARWLFRFCGETTSILICGILELSNGCLRLAEVPSESQRFILCAAFLAFGGLCVILQTLSVTDALSLGFYIPGKIMQTCLSLLTAVPLAYVLFPINDIPVQSAVILILLSSLAVICLAVLTEKSCGNSE